jgi:hypothetical protein
MAGLVLAIHAFLRIWKKAWMAATSAAVTIQDAGMIEPGAGFRLHSREKCSIVSPGRHRTRPEQFRIPG